MTQYRYFVVPYFTGDNIGKFRVERVGNSVSDLSYLADKDGNIFEFHTRFHAHIEARNWRQRDIKRETCRRRFYENNKREEVFL